jgi:GntR family transcriptional regulator, transcriptional repressor for pyruvate dehydrogenase complex
VEFDNIDRRPVAHKVADRLRDAVIAAVAQSTELPPEADLALALTVSRPTLREALRILETEGLLRRDRPTAALRADANVESMSRPLRSALHVLSRTDRITLGQVIDLRITIEARAAEVAATVARPEDVGRLAAAMAAMREPGLSTSVWNERSFAFHLAVVQASRNEAFLLIMLAVREAAAEILELAARSAPQPAGDGTAPAVDSTWADNWLNSAQQAFEAIRDHRPETARQHLLALWGGASHMSQLTEDVGEPDEEARSSVMLPAKRSFSP